MSQKVKNRRQAGDGQKGKHVGGQALAMTAMPVVLVGLLLAGLAATKSSALDVRLGRIVIKASGGFSPKRLPRNHAAPIKIYEAGRIATTDGSLPPVLKRVTLDFDRHGSLETRGLPTCRRGQLEATVVSQARRRCGPAIVGTGFGRAIVKFPEQVPFTVASPLTVFNGPKINGDASILVHAYTGSPVPTTYIVPVRINRIHKGAYGYHVDAKIPPIAGGYGIPIFGSFAISRRWTFRGNRHSYVNARCGRGHLLARGDFGFDDGTVIRATFIERCLVIK